MNIFCSLSLGFASEAISDEATDLNLLVRNASQIYLLIYEFYSRDISVIKLLFVFMIVRIGIKSSYL